VFAPSLALAIAGRGAVPRWLFWLAVAASALLAAAILTSLSRGTWLSLGVAIAVMLVVWDTRSRQFIIPAALGVGVLGLLTALGALPEVITERVQAIYDNFGVFDARAIDLTPQNFAVVERMAHWQAGWYMFLAHPWLGVGIGNYAAVYEDYALRGWADPLGHAHNFYVNTLAEMGIVGLAVLVWVLASGYVLVAGGLRRAGGRLERAILLGVLGSLIVFTVFNTFDNLLVHGMTMQLGLLFALAFLSRRGLEPDAH
jgi:O-antigen ligase